MLSSRIFLFMVLALMAVTNVKNVYATEAIDEDISLTSLYNFKNDPFTLDWTFRFEQETSPEEIADAPVSFEEKTLNRWKQKQAHLWNTLPKDKFTVNASAYTAAADECGKSDGITASGLKVAEKRTLACPPAFPFGAKIRIEGMGEYRCEDRGGAIKGNKMDIYMETKNEAFAFGRRNLIAEVIP